MKKLLALLLTLILCFSFGCTSNEQTPDTTETPTVTDSPYEEIQADSPLLYKVTDSDGDVVWLLGSIHIGREEFYPLPDYIMEPFKNADSLAVEADIIAFENDIAAQITALQQMVYTDGTTISDHIDEELYNEASEILSKLGIPFGLDYYLPIMWATLIDNIIYEELNFDASLGVDRHLLNYAKENDMKILEVESCEFQYNMMANFSEELQIIQLESAIEQYGKMEESEKEINALLDAWHKGDANVIAESYVIEEEASEEEKALYKEYIEKMLLNRNKGMTDFAVDALERSEEVFICVGMAHVVGEGSITDLLNEKGYKVEVIH